MNTNSGWLGHRRGTPTGSRSYNPPFTIVPDNTAKAAWRRNEEPLDTIPLPRRFRQLNFARELDMVGTETGTYVSVSSHPMRLLLWGPPEQVAHAKSLLHIILEESFASFQGGKANSTWVKLASLTDEGRRIHDAKIDAQELTREFRRDPSLTETFNAIGRFKWPQQEYPPRDIFGNSTEALDSIRVECGCYVIYDANTGYFKFMGEKENVMMAMLRVKLTYLQLVARQTRLSKTYLLRWKDPEEVSERVCVADYQRTRLCGPTKGQPLDSSKTPRGLGHVFRSVNGTGTEEQLRTLAKKVKDHCMATIIKLQYYNAHLSFQVRLGTMLLQRYQEVPKGGYTLEDFEKMIADPSFEGTVTQEIGDEKLERMAKARLMHEDNQGFLETRSTFHPALFELKPTYTATLVVEPKDGLGNLQLTKSWKHEEKENADIIADIITDGPPTWQRLEVGANTAKSLLEACVVDLEDGLAWQFELSASSIVPPESLPETLATLGLERFNIKPGEARNDKGDAVWCEFEKDASGNPVLVPKKKSLHLRKAWRLWTANSDYTVEVSKTQKVLYRATATTLPGKETGFAYKARWEVRVFHRNWERELAQHANLGMGRGATWQPNIKTWFPMDDTGEAGATNCGHIALMEKLYKLQSIITGQESFGGMSVG